MKINSIRLHNFITFKDSYVELGGKPTLVLGENRDELSASSNGSGKSILCQSILWVLFDRLIRKGMKKDDVIGKHDEWASVELVIEHQGQTYEATRFRNHPDHGSCLRLFVDGSDQSLHKGDNLVELLDFPEGAFDYVAYTDEKSQPLVALTPAKFMEIVSEILDLNAYDSYAKTIKKYSKDYQQKKSRNDVELARIEGALSTLQENLKQRKEFKDRFEEEKQEAIQTLISKVESAKLKIQELELSLDEVRFSKIEEHKLSMRESEKLKQRSKETLSKVKSLESRIKDSTRKENRNASLLVKTNAELDRVQEQLNNIEHNPDGICHYCGSSSMDHSYIKVRMDKLNSEKANLISSQFDQEHAMNNAKKDRLDLEERLEAEKSEYDKLSTAIQGLVDSTRVVRDYEAIESKIQTLKEGVSTGNSRIEEYSNKNSEYIEDEIRDIEAKIEAKQKPYKDLELLGEGLERDVRCCEDLVAAIKSVKASATNGFVYSLKSQIQKNLDILTDHDYLVGLDVKKGLYSFSFSQRSKGGSFMDYHSFSRGEKARIAKAVNAALERIVGIGLIIDDEGVGGVDPSGAADILGFLVDEYQEKTFLFVSHDANIQDHFENVITVVKESGTSYIKVKD